jgi:hypothetical protein
MNNLTAHEKKELNNVSQQRSVSVLLGDIVDEIIDATGVNGTPVNAEAATETLDVTGVVIDGETVSIDNPAVVGVDVYEFLADVEQTKSDPDNIAVDISGDVSFSTGTLTMDTQPTSGNTVTIGITVYTFVPVGTANADGEVSVGADLAGAQAALVAAINGTDGINTPHPLVEAGDFAADDCIITALVGGTSGDAIDTTETFTAVTNVFASGTLGAGADCTAANAITALVAAITAGDTQNVGAADGAGDTVVLTSDVAGVIGNAIEIAETMAHAAYVADATELSGGVDGTVSAGAAIMIDASYLYATPVENTTADANWRRISLGSVY